MQYSISCEQFLRLANATIKAYDDDNYPDHYRCIYLENKNSHAYAVATNGKIMAVEHLGGTRNPDGRVLIMITDMLLGQCAAEIAHDGFINISVTDVPGFKYAALTTTHGFSYPMNAAFFPPDDDWPRPWYNWRRILPDAMSLIPSGFLYMKGELLANLCKSCPSGSIVFPEVINTTQPILVRDSVDPDWCGLFLGTSQKLNAKPALFPEWLR